MRPGMPMAAIVFVRLLVFIVLVTPVGGSPGGATWGRLSGRCLRGS
jgi:hypothetical protein